MAPTTNARVLFNSVPTDYPIPGETTVYDTSQTIHLETHPLNGGFLVKTLVLSVDPYFRGLMDGGKSYVPGFALGEPLHGFGVGVVVRSEHNEVKPGKYVYGMGFLHQEYFVLPNMEGFVFLEKHPQLPWTVYVGAAGMTGKTAYAGWKEFSRAKKGETAFVTTGAGAVGAMVIQLAKRDGLKVIASAGSDDKVEFMRSLGADIAYNYKTTDTREVLAREGPIDVYWDNVGGSFLDAALEYAAVYGRFLECGMMTGYNSEQRVIKNLNQTYTKSLTISGVAVFRLTKYEEEFYATVPAQLASGELKYSEDVSYGLEKVGDVLLAVQKGENTGKAVVVVAQE
ncbi:NAD-P-binding protein [Mycena polygramma]|nr:NAD-P-binding protein [Mycena polygramma]KAJ7663252.1 NAD-P-binding protein [Mycena polygramma]